MPHTRSLECAWQSNASRSWRSCCRFSSQRDARRSANPRRLSHGATPCLIAIDTLRADKLGCYGSTLGATPCIDELAASGVLFEHAYSHAPWTLPSFASMFTSLYPQQHGAGGQLPDFRGLSSEVHTVAERFRDAGFATAAVVNVDFLDQAFGMTRGFEHVDFKAYPNNVQVRPAKRTTTAALQWLRNRPDEPFFLLVHYFDPHLVYAPPKKYRLRFASPADRESTAWVFGRRQQIVAYRQGADPVRRADDSPRRAPL